MSVRLILDTDIGTDVDDALALVYALRHPDIDLVAVTTVADDVVRRAHIARKLLRMAGREDVEVAPGVGWERSPSGRRSWFGHEGEGLLQDADTAETFGRHGVDVLLERTAQEPLEIAVVGMQSNMAAAVDRDPTFPSRAGRVHVMGGVFAPVRFGEHVAPPTEHNLIVDPEASMRALNAGFDIVYTPLDVTVHAHLQMKHLHALRDSGDELCQALVPMLELWRKHARYPGETAALLHDPLAVACAVDRSFVTVERMPVTVALHDGVARTFVDRAGGREADVLTSVDGPAFADHWLEVALSG